MPKPSGLGALGLLLLVGASACEQRRDPEVRASCPTWKTTVRPEIERRCTACHPTFSSYRAFTVDEVAIAGDPDSPLLAALSSSATVTGHRVPSSTRDLLTTWVVDCELRYDSTPIHESGLLDPRSTNFHATLWREAKYSETACRDCHGSPTSGRGDAPGCETCHAGGEEACSTCHARIESQGAHRIHLRGASLGLRYDCALCHQVPTELRSPGHVFSRLDPETVDIAGAEVDLVAAAGERAEYDPSTTSCRDVRCHVVSAEDTQATRPAPVWTAPLAEAACDRCHGAPPAGHVSDRCVDCHPKATLDNGTNGTRHLNGQVELGRSGAGTCDDCHGAGELGAVPPDLEGRTDPRFAPVGAHAAHLSPTRRLGNAAACGDCHLVPTRVSEPGHIDSQLPAEVFPAEIAGTSLAFVGSSAPVYRTEDTRCANVYCHGAATPDWTKTGLFEVSCGACHGVPPSSTPHTSDMNLTSCNQCHAASIDAFGNFIFQGGPEGRKTVHIDGRVDL